MQDMQVRKITHILNRKNKMRISSLPIMRLAKSENTRMIFTAKRISFTMKQEITLYVLMAKSWSLLMIANAKVRMDMKQQGEITYVRTVRLSAPRKMLQGKIWKSKDSVFSDNGKAEEGSHTTDNYRWGYYPENEPFNSGRGSIRSNQARLCI